MTKLTCLLALFLCVGFHPPTKAESSFSLGVEGIFSLPVLPWSRTAGIGMGGLAKLSYAFSPSGHRNFSLNLRLGIISHFETTSSESDYYSKEMLALMGLRTGLSQDLYLEAALGPVLSEEKEVDSHGGMGVAIGMNLGVLIGVAYEIAGVNMGISLFFPRVVNFIEDVGFHLTMGFDIFS